LAVSRSMQNTNQTQSTYEMANNGRGGGGKGPSNKRRRMRGGGVTTSKPTHVSNGKTDDDVIEISHLVEGVEIEETGFQGKEEIIVDEMENLEQFYQLNDMKNLVVVHPYSGDLDDQLLEELRPSHIILYEPDAAFIRRIEVIPTFCSDRTVFDFPNRFSEVHTERTVFVCISCIMVGLPRSRSISVLSAVKKTLLQNLLERKG